MIAGGWGDFGPQLGVRGAHHACSPPQGILGEGPLRQPHPTQETQDRGDLAYQNPRPIVQRMSGCQEPWPQAMSGGPY